MTGTSVARPASTRRWAFRCQRRRDVDVRGVADRRPPDDFSVYAETTVLASVEFGVTGPPTHLSVQYGFILQRSNARDYADADLIAIFWCFDPWGLTMWAGIGCEGFAHWATCEPVQDSLGSTIPLAEAAGARPIGDAVAAATSNAARIQRRRVFG